MYLLINPNLTVNFADDHPINPSLDVHNLQLIERKDQSLTDVVGDIPPEAAIWHPETQQVIRDPAIHSPHLAVQTAYQAVLSPVETA